MICLANIAALQTGFIFFFFPRLDKDKGRELEVIVICCTI